MGSGAAWLDFDQDGRLDLYLIHNVARTAEVPTTAGSPGPARATNRLYRQEENGRFRDVSAGSGLDVTGPSHGLAVGDVNNDGLPEVLLTEYDGVRLFLNRGNRRFEDITQAAGVTNAEWSVTAAFFDYDRDGWLDLVVANYLDFDPGQRCLDARGQPDFCGPQGFRPTITRLFRNTGPHSGGTPTPPRFVDVSVPSGIARSPGKAMQVVCADFDGDRWPDIFVTDDARPNRLFMNRRDGTFGEEAVIRGVAYTGMGAAAANMGIALGDINQDGLFDLFVPHLGEENHTLWRQMARGVFQDTTAEAGLLGPRWHGTGFGAVFGDFDCDEALDLAIVNGRIRRPVPGTPALRCQPGIESFWQAYAEPPQLFAGDGTGRFAEISTANPELCDEAFVGRGLAMGDYDNDGGLDLVTVGIGGPVRLMRNRGPRGHWVGVRAIDPALGGRDAFGAEVSVEVNGGQHWRLVQPAFSYSSSQDARVHVGLGARISVDAILVRWPDGSDERFAGGPADRYVTLRKGTGKAEANDSRSRTSETSAALPNANAAPPKLVQSIAAEPADQPKSTAPSNPGPKPHQSISTPGLDPAVARLIEHAQAVLAREPHSAKAWGTLGSILMHYEYVLEARQAFTEAERLAPREPRWPYLHAVLVMNTDATAALARLRRAAELCPTEPDSPRLRLAQFLAERGDRGAAEILFRALLAGMPAHPPARLGLARILHQRGDYTNAQQLLESCRSEPHVRKAAHELLASVQRAAGKDRDASTTARMGAALPADRTWPDPFWDEASTNRTGLKHQLAEASGLLDLGEPTRAITILTDLSRHHPEDPEVWYLIGWAQNQRSEAVAAERALREHLQRAPDSAKGLAQLAVALLSRGRPAEARPLLERAVQLKPLWRELHSNLGFAAIQLGQPADAERHYRQALRCDPNHVPTYAALAELLLRRGDLRSRADARRLLETIMALAPDDPRARPLLERLDATE